MSKNTVLKKRRLSISSHAAIVITVGTILSWNSLSAGAQQRTSARESVRAPAPAAMPADLERAFWLCDYAGTTGSVDTGTAMACSTITEELKIQKFNGDFDAMLAWWRENKPGEHQAIEAAGRASAGNGRAKLTAQ
jgi:hypothetical protein